MKQMQIFPKVYLTLIMILSYIPIMITVLYSFNESRISSVWTGFSLKWYTELFYNRDIREALFNSILVSGVSCILSALIGTLGAVGMRGYHSRFHEVLSYISSLPIMIPEIILGMVFLAVFSLLRLPFGFLTLIIGHCTFCVPYIFLTVRARLIGIDQSLEDAARDLGAKPLRVLRDIILPEIFPAVISGMLLAFAMSFDDVIISILVTGPTVTTLPVLIYTKLKTGVTPEINALASIMLIVTCIIIGITAIVDKRKQQYISQE